MQAQQLSVKFFVEDPAGLDLGAFIPVFHGWIRDHRLGDRLLIDVADYRHVRGGPGVVLVGHDAHYALDQTGGRPGLSFNRKRDPAGDLDDRLGEALREALSACLCLEQDPGARVRFRTDTFQVRILSRLSAANTPEAFAEAEPALRAFAARLYPKADVTITRLDEDERAPFGVEIRASEAPPLVTLLARVDAARDG